MAGGNLAAGIPLVLLAIGVTILTTYVSTQSAMGQDAEAIPGCTNDGCDDMDVSDWFAAVVLVSITGIPGAPLIVNVLYLLVVGGAYITGVILVAAGILGTLAGGG